MDTVKMQVPGVTIEVPVSEVNFYKRAGYSVVASEPVEPEPTPIPEPEQLAKKVKK